MASNNMNNNNNVYLSCAHQCPERSHKIYINLNIFYTHVEHSPIKNNLHKVLYGNTHMHTHRSVNEFECA